MVMDGHTRYHTTLAREVAGGNERPPILTDARHKQLGMVTNAQETLLYCLSKT